MKILLIDDDTALLSLLKDILEEYDHEIIQRENAIEALEYLKRHPCDMVLLDWFLPHMTGLEFLTQLRLDPRTSSAFVVMVTGNHDMAAIREALGCGVDEYLMKPFTKEMLLDKMAMVTKKALLKK